ncbi:unnamed protein product [Plutella xylostella]|uniref:(diamondback moth) hypothetical protein n=1 Tax=Plutella xylostella TaxID=51655 RepID=A0A8S4D156_PLUXY|nr:unnamed protein product [Plutella xylostella]
MEAECQKVATWYICNHKARIQNKEHRDCVYDLIYQQEIEGTCHPTPISLYKEALLELDSQHYIMSFPKPTKVQLECGQEEHRLLEGSFLATIPHNCYIKSPEFTAYNIENKVLGYAVEITASQKLPESSKSRVRYNFTTIDLNKLHNIQQQIMTESPAKLDTADINGLISNTGHSVIFTVENETRHHINITGGPLSYKYQFHEIHIHYGLHDQFGSEHTVNGYSFPAEIQIFGFNSQLYSNFSEALHKAQGIVSISLLLQVSLRYVIIKSNVGTLLEYTAQK